MKQNLEPVFITARDIPDAWYQSIRWLLQESTGSHRYKIDQGSYAGQYRLELDYATIQIKYPWSTPMVPDTPVGVPCPSSDDYVAQYILKLMTSQKDLNEEYTYGERIENQIPKIIERYKAGPGNNQLVLQIAGPPDLELADPPCLRHIDTRILDGRLHFFPYFRSWDLWAGFPNNLAAIQHLKKYMADMIGVEDGDIIASSKGLHLYEYTWEMAGDTVNR